eukprot:sb/3475061/
MAWRLSANYWIDNGPNVAKIMMTVSWSIGLTVTILHNIYPKWSDPGTLAKDVLNLTLIFSTIALNLVVWLRLRQLRQYPQYYNCAVTSLWLFINYLPCSLYYATCYTMWIVGYIIGKNKNGRMGDGAEEK